MNYVFTYYIDGEQKKFSVDASDYTGAVYFFAKFIAKNPRPDSFGSYYRCEERYRKFRDRLIFEAFCGKV